MPMEIIIKHSIEANIESEKRKTIEGSEFDEEAAAGFLASGVEDPSGASPEIKDSRDGESDGVSPERRKIRN